MGSWCHELRPYRRLDLWGQSFDAWRGASDILCRRSELSKSRLITEDIASRQSHLQTRMMSLAISGLHSGRFPNLVLTSCRGVLWNGSLAFELVVWTCNVILEFRWRSLPTRHGHIHMNGASVSAMENRLLPRLLQSTSQQCVRNTQGAIA